ncbi:DNA replication licensing factor mcm2 [Gracilariopsis chorda]|uniref:DNA replication licensing factor MCM2 n=1 Tax=Gracilariopsis chorda TaxID=448386 RepID=A0A2V3IFR4_9FLOR|nr:DNA replication licensing factor mcm2 [Gracilariopsis chorda]|eukprot:PXF40917.1 DNA replication licensing factor mcm2 [Gracilariopsis chorda]
MSNRRSSTDDTGDPAPPSASAPGTGNPSSFAPVESSHNPLPDSDNVEPENSYISHPQREFAVDADVAEAQVLTNHPQDEEEDEGEDLLGDDMVNDYRPLEQLDRYEVDPAAENDQVAPMTAAARRRAERELHTRDLRDRRNQHALAAAGDIRMNDSDSEEEGVAGFQSRRNRRRAIVAGSRSQPAPPAGSDAPTPQSGAPTPALSFANEDMHMPVNDDPLDLDASAFQGQPISQIVEEERVRKELARRFESFLKSFTDEKTESFVYMDRIRAMAANNAQSLVINFRHFTQSEPTVATWLADAPSPILEIYNKVATEVTFTIFQQYRRVHPEIFVRIAEFPILDNLRDIRHVHLNTLIKVSGVVTRRSGVFPHLRIVKLNCEKCRRVLTPPSTTTIRPERSIRSCPECESRGPFTINSEESIFGNFQKLTLQERPGSVPAGRLPRYKEIILLNDLIDCARPGEEVEVTGTYRHNIDAVINIQNGFPVFCTIIEANYVRKVEDARAESELTDDDIAEIRKLSRDPRIAERIFASIAPSIYGHSHIKRALALALFGGQAKEVGEKHRIRGDINVLLLGDPGTAKSQFLKYVEKTANRAVYTTGKGASAVGLTAVVHKDPVTREWTLEGGALVLADRGVCLIDEFDKMNDSDRTSIHEAMEQQSISVSKAGIVTSLQARCSVFAAANPVKGRYDPSLSFYDNVDLTEPILSRFDVLCVVRDTVDASKDETLAKFVVDSHIRSHPQLFEDEEEGAEGSESKINQIVEYGTSSVELIPQAMLRKYLLYAKRTVIPKLSNMDKEKISALYIDLRRESMSSGGMPIALRHLESIVRLAESNARLHLREYVREDDINTAIAVMLESFFASQKYSLMRQMRRRFHKYLAFRRDDNELLLYILNGLVRDYSTTQTAMQAAGGEGEGSGESGQQRRRVEVDMEDFEARARELNVYSCQRFYDSGLFKKWNFSVDQNRQVIVKAL